MARNQKAKNVELSADQSKERSATVKPEGPANGNEERQIVVTQKLAEAIEHLSISVNKLAGALRQSSGP